MEREYLQLHSQIHLADLNVRWNLEHDGGEVEDALDTARDEPVTDRLRGGGRSGDDADGNAPLGADPRELALCEDGSPPNGPPIRWDATSEHSSTGEPTPGDPP